MLQAVWLGVWGSATNCRKGGSWRQGVGIGDSGPSFRGPQMHRTHRGTPVRHLVGTWQDTELSERLPLSPQALPSGGGSALAWLGLEEGCGG